MNHPCVIRPARWPDDAAAVRRLLREYEASLPYSLCFQGFTEELDGLPGKYTPPKGAMLIAELTSVSTDVVGDAKRTTVAGTVAFRELDPSGVLPEDPQPICEMKRLYVAPWARGRSIGRLLCEALILAARNAGYRFMKLDSDAAGMAEAVGLYRSLGFKDVPRYNDDPIDGTIWLGRTL
jgi:putative acetyltransferase